MGRLDSLQVKMAEVMTELERKNGNKVLEEQIKLLEAKQENRAREATEEQVKAMASFGISLGDKLLALNAGMFKPFEGRVMESIAKVSGEALAKNIEMETRLRKGIDGVSDRLESQERQTKMSCETLNQRTDELEKKALVLVSEDQQSLAIGKGGQNVRLAAKLTGWKIDIQSTSPIMPEMEMSPEKDLEPEE